MSTNQVLSDNINLLPNEITGKDDAVVMVRLRVRRKTSSQWLSYGEIIPVGEPCFSIDTGEMRIGDGVHTWAELQTSLGLPSNLYQRVTAIDTDGTSKQFTTLIIDDGELV